MTLKLRKEGELPQCSVVGCREYPGIKSHGRDFCESHASEFSKLITEHIYANFLEALKHDESAPKLQFYANAGHEFPKLKCSVQGCERLACGGIGLFESVKELGFLYLCEDHNKMMQAAIKHDWGNRLLWERTERRKIREDSERAKRIKAIKTSAAKHKDEENYIAKVCTDLTTKRIKMLPSWLERWERKSGLRFEPHEWTRAYQDKQLRPAIQNHISRHK